MHLTKSLRWLSLNVATNVSVSDSKFGKCATTRLISPVESTIVRPVIFSISRPNSGNVISRPSKKCENLVHAYVTSNVIVYD